jgi:hypothetical protein
VNRYAPVISVILGIAFISGCAFRLRAAEDATMLWAPALTIGLLLICLGLGLQEFRQAKAEEISEPVWRANATADSYEEYAFSDAVKSIILEGHVCALSIWRGFWCVASSGRR